VWFDSGSMPYAQWHYPFENKEKVDQEGAYPADFIAEGVDQTRGWFYTLHAISTMVFGKVAYKNVISNGLVLDKNGQKMSTRLGNGVDPFETLEKYGPDATRWYMITNAQPWDNLKFDTAGIEETQRKFFGTLYNTYGFFALYANLDSFDFSDAEVPLADRPEIDRWVISKLNTLVKEVNEAYENYEPTQAGRLIQAFTLDQLSNWYVRLCRRRFWKGEYTQDKASAYQTLYTCLETIAMLSAPIAPFFSDRLFCDLNSITGRHTIDSVHLSDFPTSVSTAIDNDLEERMAIAQQVSSMVLSLRKKEGIRVRQPLQKVMIPVLDSTFERQLSEVADLIKSEVNIKEIAYLSPEDNTLVKKIKPNFKSLGPKYGKIMKAIAGEVAKFGQKEIAEIEQNGAMQLHVADQEVILNREDVEISTDDIAGWLVTTEGKVTVALDITLSEELRNEGIAREFVNRIQNLRKSSGFEVTDRIAIAIENHAMTTKALELNLNYICSETLADSLEILDEVPGGEDVEIDENVTTKIRLSKLN